MRLKILCGGARTCARESRPIDVWNGGIRQIDAPPRDPECPACGRREFPYLEDGSRPPVSLCGRNAVQIAPEGRAIDLAELQSRLEPFWGGPRQRVRAAVFPRAL